MKKLVLAPLLFFCISVFGQHDSIKTGKFKLIDGWQSMEYRYMEFKNTKGDSIYAEVFDTCLTKTGYHTVWDSVGPPIRISSAFINKKYKVTYYMTDVRGPNSDGQTIYGMVIKKMELLK